MQGEFIFPIDLPPTITHLNFYSFNGHIPILPSSITHLSIKYSTIDIKFFPPLLIYLKLTYFGNPIPPVPQTVTNIFIKSNKNDATIPASITHLHTNMETLDYPPSLTHLWIIKTFPPILPSTLVFLSLKRVRNFPSWYHLHYLTHLEIHKSSSPNPMNPLPHSLTTLVIRETQIKMPNLDISHLTNLTTLELPCGLPLINAPPSLTHLYSYSKYHSFPFPPSLSHITLISPYDTLPFNMKIYEFPSSLAYLELNAATVKLGSLPPSLLHLHLQSTYCSGFQYDSLPPALQSLSYLTSDFFQFVDHLPTTLTHLTFGLTFNKPVDCLPPSLLHLTFGNSFDKDVDHLPQSLTHLKFGKMFKNPIDHLPVSLTHLAFEFEFLAYCDSNFNQPIDHLPYSLQSLVFSSQSTFNQPIDHLPPNLTHLSLGSFFNHPIDYLPRFLSHLTFRNGSQFDQPIDHLPPHLTYLSFENECEFNQPLDNLPRLLTYLNLCRFKSSLFQSLNNLPPFLTVLNMDEESALNGFHYLPETLLNPRKKIATESTAKKNSSYCNTM